jgi:hypothetical protein
VWLAYDDAVLGASFGVRPLRAVQPDAAVQLSLRNEKVARTIWLFREKLTTNGAINVLR